MRRLQIQIHTNPCDVETCPASASSTVCNNVALNPSILYTVIKTVQVLFMKIQKVIRKILSLRLIFFLFFCLKLLRSGVKILLCTAGVISVRTLGAGWHIQL